MAEETKKISLIRMMEILRKYSDVDHKLTQAEIIELLEEEYDITLERKAVASNIAMLQECGYDIVNTGRGTYMNSHEFDDTELRMLIDGVLSSNYITQRHSQDIIERLCNISSTYFASHMDHIKAIGDWNKSDNHQLFYNIEIIDEAIRGKKRISYDYNKYGIDKKLHKSSQQIVTPYQMILHNQRYYLMAYSEYWGNMVFHRLDHITNINLAEGRFTPIKKVPGYEQGIDYKALSTMMPYMYTDEIENITFLADKAIIDQIVDWFGKTALITECADDDTKVTVVVKASQNAMEHWVMQYVNAVEVVAPLEFRERIKTVLKKAVKKYK